MKPLYFILIPLLLSCSSEKKEIKEGEKAENESIAYEPKFPDSLKKLISNFNTSELPFRADSNLLEKLDAQKFVLLDNEQILSLYSNYVPSEKWNSYYVDEVIGMNLRKRNSTYESYLESLDLAMLKDANAYAIQLFAKEDIGLMLWGIEYSSYEACPFYAGWELYVSVIKEGKVDKCIKVGGIQSAGDPPAMSSIMGLFDLNSDLKLTRKLYREFTEDMDAGEPERERDFDTLILM
ncbi:MAG: hypothetical protein EP305_09240 [Bacteroidetes bacterium]|nr:MAG: hypothetical protein EP305_09240 [Bacteroidota bacterium]